MSVLSPTAVICIGLCLALTPAALAGSASVEVANEEVRDGVHGMLARVRADYQNDLRRHRIQLDPAHMRLFIALLDGQGREVFGLDDLDTVGLDVNSATTTPPLPADGAAKSFFVPYHRLDLPAGSHRLTLQLYLDAGLPSGPMLVASQPDITVRMPTLDWVFASVEQPPRAADRIVWRALLGDDVIVEGAPQAPSVVVLSEQDHLELEVQDRNSLRWKTLNRANLAKASADAGLSPGEVRAVQVRRRPPRIRSGNLSLKPAEHQGQQGRQIDMGWTLSGGSMDVLLELDVVPVAGAPDGKRIRLPGWALASVPGRASLFVPDWGLPDWVNASTPLRVGFEVMVKGGRGSPLSRDLVLGGHEATVSLGGGLSPAPMAVRQVSARVKDDDGLSLEVTYDWTLPEGLPDRLPGVDLMLSHAVPAQRVRALAPFTAVHAPCDQGRCRTDWASGPVTSRAGRTRVQVPLYLLDPKDDGLVKLHIAGRPEGYRGAQGTLRVKAQLPRPMTMTLEPKMGRFDCPPDGSVRLAWLGRHGEELAATAARPCRGPVKWKKEDALVVTAFEGDALLLSIEQGSDVLRRTSIRVGERKGRWEFTAPFAGVHEVVGKLTIE